MDVHIFIALVGGLLNAGLSVTVPCLLKNTNQPFLTQVKKVYDTNREVILTSSFIVVLTIYLALKVATEIKPAFSNITWLENDSASLSGLYGQPTIVTDKYFMSLANLEKLLNSNNVRI